MQNSWLQIKAQNSHFTILVAFSTQSKQQNLCTVHILMGLKAFVHLRVCAGHQRGGAGAAGQHDDADGRHREQM